MGAAELNRYLSPASLYPMTTSASFVGFPRTFISAGGAENLLAQIRVLKKRMVRDIGEDVEDGTSDESGRVRYYEAGDAPHDFLLFSWTEPERENTLSAITRWIETCSKV